MRHLGFALDDQRTQRLPLQELQLRLDAGLTQIVEHRL